LGTKFTPFVTSLYNGSTIVPPLLFHTAWVYSFCVPLRIPPPIIALAAAALIWALHRWLPLAHLITSPWNALGAVIGALGIVINLAAFRRFRRVGTTVNPLDPSKATLLLTDGIFSLTRNPMYLGLLLLLVGWAIWLGSTGVWLVPPLFWVVITYGQIVPEERALTRLFGERYLTYKGAVARWIGRLANEHPPS
jgi:protein-S-isoprenylcysteine O-methyltransferase Ste14